MANFKTHLNVAAATTCLTAATLLAAEHINLTTALGLWFLGTIGGLLPDIDSDNSTSLDIIFNLFTFSAVLIMLRYVSKDSVDKKDIQQFSLVELIALPLLTYALMKHMLRPIFEKITVHRGSCHSLLFVLLMALITTHTTLLLSSEVNTQTINNAWLAGGFIFLGGFTHLLLDEIYSVDLSNARIKRSFGSALKLAYFRNRSITLLTIFFIAALAYTAPPANQTLNMLSNWSKLHIIPHMSKTEE